MLLLAGWLFCALFSIYMIWAMAFLTMDTSLRDQIGGAEGFKERLSVISFFMVLTSLTLAPIYGFIRLTYHIVSLMNG